MQIHLIHPSLNQLWKYISYEEVLPPEACQLKEKLHYCEELRNAKLSWKSIKEIVSIGRSTYYRCKKLVKTIGIKGLIAQSKRPKKLRESKISVDTINLIETIRKENPTYGKAKIAVILKRDHADIISESSVGRVLKKLLESGKIQRSASAIHKKRKRSFRKHAQRWLYDKYKPKCSGEMVQIDHMSVTKNGISFKEFQAWDPLSKYVFAQVFSNATSRSAKKFLEQLIQYFPFKIKSIQVDGGSEFMADFEEACEELNIPLYVLPPRKPKYNGGVERSNRIFREELYARNDFIADSIGAVRFHLKQAVQKYNEYRPHKSLDYLTPLEYIKQSLRLTA